MKREWKITFSCDLVRLSELSIDESVQAPIRANRVAAIVASFEERAFGVPIISARSNGTKVVVDGRHRTTAAKKLGFEYIPAVIWTGLSPEEEARIFIACNSNRKAPDRVSVFLVKAIFDPVTQEIVRILDSEGFKIVQGHASSMGDIRAAEAIEYVYGWGGEQALRFVLQTLSGAWAARPKDCITDIIRGLYIFHISYPTVKVSSLAKALSRVSGSELSARSSLMRTATMRRPMSCMAEIIVAQYNSVHPGHQVDETTMARKAKEAPLQGTLPKAGGEK